MLRSSLFAILLTSTPALAGVLVADRVAVGINSDGSLCDPSAGVGLLYDPDGTDGDTPLGSDLLLPGRDFELWGATWRSDAGPQSITAGQPDIQGGPDVDWDAPVQTLDMVYQQGHLPGADLSISPSIELPIDGDIVWMSFRIQAHEAIAGLQLVRAVDSDPDWFVNGGYSTNNRADGDVVVAASRLDGGKSLALGVDGGTAAVCRSWCTSPADVLAGVTDTLDGDRVIGVVSAPVDLAAGETITVRFAYGLGTSATTALERATDAMVTDDLDGDGRSTEDGDCDDRDSQRSPDLPEQADGLDNDCDDEIDEDTVVSDDDGDGFAEVDGDCDDDDDRVYPGAAPLEGVADADCDGLADVDSFREEDRPDGWGLEEVTGGCQSAPAPAAAWLLLLPILLLRRRA